MCRPLLNSAGRGLPVDDAMTRFSFVLKFLFWSYTRSKVQQLFVPLPPTAMPAAVQRSAIRFRPRFPLRQTRTHYPQHVLVWGDAGKRASELR